MKVGVTDFSHSYRCSHGFQDYVAVQTLRVNGAVGRSQADESVRWHQDREIHEAGPLAARDRPQLDAITMLLMDFQCQLCSSKWLNLHLDGVSIPVSHPNCLSALIGWTRASSAIISPFLTALPGSDSA